MKVLVTGALGYIGQVLQEELKKAGLDVEILDNDLYDIHKDFPEDKKLDLLDKDLIEDAVKDCDVIVNLAAVVGDPACLVNTRYAIEVNCVGTRNLVELANKYDKRIIHASTCSVYGAEKENKKLVETSTPFPIDFYGQTKYQQERIVRDLIENKKNYCIFRLGTAYGLSPRMRYDLVINTFAARAANGEKLSVFGGTQYRPFVHIRDVARAIIFAIENDLDGIYNLANENITIKELANIIKDLTNTDIEIIDEIEDPRNYIADNTKLLNTGFKFEWNIEKGVKEILESPTVKNYKDAQYSDLELMKRVKENGN